MVNYVLSFCKITGASKIFSRNFYLPLLKPLTPKEALRTLRITGKWLLGAKIQHYIPVLLNHKKKRPKKAKNYGKTKHRESDMYTYMTPVLDSENNESHKMLAAILEGKANGNNNNNGTYVYTVEDKMYNIVLEASLENAIRDGEIIDVLVSQRTDKIIVKLKNFKKVPLEIEYFDTGDGDGMFYGEGATSPDEEKFHHHGKYTMSLAKIFEDKELMEEKWEEELRRIMKKRRRQAKEGSKEWKAMMKESIKNLDWNKFEEDAKRVVEEIDEPAVEQDIDMEIDDLEATKDVREILEHGDLLGNLPTLTEIPDIIRNMGSATFEVIEQQQSGNNKQRRLSGVRVTLGSGKECFVSGQMVHTEEGDVFVPGQTIENEFGLEYTPGITILVDNKPTLISGLIMGEEERDPMFLPAQSTITADGQLTFAATAEERPQLEPEQKELRQKRKEARLKALEPEPEPEPEIEDNESLISDDHPMESISSIELNTSELDELDAEATRREQQRLEMEALKAYLLDDGMDELIASLEDKKAKLKQKLDELRKLSVAAEASLVSYVNETHTLEIAAKVSADVDIINRISDILLTMTRRAATFRDRNSVNPDNINKHQTGGGSAGTKLRVLLKTALVAANDAFKSRPRDQILALNSLAEIMVEPLEQGNVLEELLNVSKTPKEREELCDGILKQLTVNLADTKVALVGSIADNNCADVMETVVKICKNCCELQAEAFGKVARLNPEVLGDVAEHLQGAQLKNEEAALQSLRVAMVRVAKGLAQRVLQKLGKHQVEEDAASFAIALDAKVTDDFVERVVLIRMLAQRDFSLKSALERIKKNPERARNDPRIRQLIRESAVLISTDNDLITSRDIPLKLMKSQNLLAIEDFLAQHCSVPHPILISRNEMQAVIPKEAARGVLAGRVPYALIDERGITNFKVTSSMTNNRDNFIEDSYKRPSKTESRIHKSNYSKENVRKLKKLFSSSRSRQVA